MALHCRHLRPNSCCLISGERFRPTPEPIDPRGPKCCCASPHYWSFREWRRLLNARHWYRRHRPGKFTGRRGDEPFLLPPGANAHTESQPRRWFRLVLPWNERRCVADTFGSAERVIPRDSAQRDATSQPERHIRTEYERRRATIERFAARIRTTTEARRKSEFVVLEQNATTAHEIDGHPAVPRGTCVSPSLFRRSPRHRPRPARDFRLLPFRDEPPGATELVAVRSRGKKDLRRGVRRKVVARGQLLAVECK